MVAEDGNIGDGGEGIDREGGVSAVDSAGREDRLKLGGELGLELANGSGAG